MAPTFLLLYAITNEKTVKLTQRDRIQAESRASPQKHVPITLVGIPYLNLIYQLGVIHYELGPRPASW